jgi:siderophore synthetase component
MTPGSHKQVLHLGPSQQLLHLIHYKHSQHLSRRHAAAESFISIEGAAIGPWHATAAPALL